MTAARGVLRGNLNAKGTKDYAKNAKANRQKPKAKS